MTHVPHACVCVFARGNHRNDLVTKCNRPTKTFWDGETTPAEASNITPSPVLSATETCPVPVSSGDSPCFPPRVTAMTQVSFSANNFTLHPFFFLHFESMNVPRVGMGGWALCHGIALGVLLVLLPCCCCCCCCCFEASGKERERCRVNTNL